MSNTTQPFLSNGPAVPERFPSVSLSAERPPVFDLDPLPERIFKQAYQSTHTTFKDALRFRYFIDGKADNKVLLNPLSTARVE